MMEPALVALSGAVGSVAFFGCIAFSVWIDYRKKKDEREATHQERMKALELGYPPLEAEIERARAYASAAWAVGLIGLLVPLAVVLLAVIGTLVAVLNLPAWENITFPLIVAWLIAAVLVLVTVVRSLSAIRQLPRPTGETMRQGTVPDRQGNPSSTAFQGRRSGLEP
jgi:uncharacterized integral membrane protein